MNVCLNESTRVLNALKLRIMPVVPEIADDEGAEVIDYAEIPATDYFKMRDIIERNNPDEGCTSFCETYDGDNYSARIEGIMWRTFTKVGDGRYTPLEEIEDIEINIELFVCYNAEGDVIRSDFDYSVIG